MLLITILKSTSVENLTVFRNDKGSENDYVLKAAQEQFKQNSMYFLLSTLILNFLNKKFFPVVNM